MIAAVMTVDVSAIKAVTWREISVKVEESEVVEVSGEVFDLSVEESKWGESMCLHSKHAHHQQTDDQIWFLSPSTKQACLFMFVCFLIAYYYSHIEDGLIIFNILADCLAH